MKINIGDKINLILLESSKFKTNLLSVYIQRPLNKDEVTKNALLASVLKCGCEKYPSQKQISNELDNLYGAYLYADVSKKGEKQIFTFKLSMIDEAYLDEDIFKKSMEFLNEIINKPCVENGGFKKEYVEIEKENLKDTIKSRINDKGTYALERCIEEMCKNENYSIYEYGYEKDVDFIDSSNLYNHYKNIIKTSPIDIVVSGSFDRDKVIDMVKNIFKFERECVIDLPIEQIKTPKKPVKNIVDKMDITQGKLVLGYRTNVDYKDDEYYSLMLYSNILGGGPHSKLFINVREKESLCYYVYSGLDRYKGLMLIPCGIEVDNFEKAIKLIQIEVENMSLKNITNEEIEKSKKAVVNGIKSVNDSINGISDFYYGQLLGGTNETLESIIEKINKVSIEDVVKVSKNINLDTVYFLRN